MYEQFLIQAGLTKDQSVVYQTLMQGGLMPARVISQKTGLKRGLAYKVLEQLIEMGLTEKRDNVSKITLFTPTHPSRLKVLAQQRIEEMKNSEVSLDSVLGKMVSDFNLISGKPNVQFFEGMEGFIKVAEDSLASETEVCQYMDIDTVIKEVHDVDQIYAKKWRVQNIPKRIIYRESPTLIKEIEALKNYNAAARSIVTPESWNTVIQIYENKVSYVCFKRDSKIGIIIEDPNIYQIQKMLFEQMWLAAKPLLEFPPKAPEPATK